MQRWEVFTINDGKVGGLWREYADMTLRTRIVFLIEGEAEPYRAESVIRFQEDGNSWKHYIFQQEPGGVNVSSVRTDDRLGENTLPSYGEFMLLLDVIGSGAESEQYQRIQDSEPSAVPGEAEIRAAGIENVALPGGSQDCRRYEVQEGGKVVGTHWATAEGLVCSDWNGPISYPGPKDEVLDGLRPEILSFLRNGFQDA